jgi:hypothetical protein
LQSAALDELTPRRVLAGQMPLAEPRSRTVVSGLLLGGQPTQDIEACGLGRAQWGLWHVRAGMPST